LSSDVVSVAFLLLELAAPKPEIRHSIHFDRYASKYLAGTEKLVLVNHLNLFEFFLTEGNKSKLLEVRSGE
jgi:hypothetical protein